MADISTISTVSRTAKLSGAVTWKAALNAVKSTLGDPASATFGGNADRLNSQLDITTDAYANDPSLIARQMPTAMKQGATLAIVVDLIGQLISAAGKPDAADPTHDVDIIAYAVRLLLIHAWEKLVHLSKANNTIISN